MKTLNSHDAGFVPTTLKIPRHLLHRSKDIARKRGFASLSEFFRYAIRKELDYQTVLIYVPRVEKI